MPARTKRNRNEGGQRVTGGHKSNLERVLLVFPPHTQRLDVVFHRGDTVPLFDETIPAAMMTSTSTSGPPPNRAVASSRDWPQRLTHSQSLLAGPEGPRGGPEGGLRQLGSSSLPRRIHVGSLSAKNNSFLSMKAVNTPGERQVEANQRPRGHTRAWGTCVIDDVISACSSSWQWSSLDACNEYVCVCVRACVRACVRVYVNGMKLQGHTYRWLAGRSRSTT